VHRRGRRDSLTPSTKLHIKSSVWHERFSKSRGIPYYHNPVTGESVWEEPKGPGVSIQRDAAGAAGSAPMTARASHILGMFACCSFACFEWENWV
jgi:hypothetical protein